MNELLRWATEHRYGLVAGWFAVVGLCACFMRGRDQRVENETREERD